MILAHKSHAFAAMRFALARLGAVLVPINVMLQTQEVAFILRHAGVTMLATDTALSSLARGAAALTPTAPKLIWLPAEEPGTPRSDMIDFDVLATCDAAMPDVTLDGNDLVQIVYTSGTESTPKGAMLTHDAIMWQYVSCVVDAGIACDDLTLHSMPMFHCAQLDVFFGPSIYVGATNVITARPVPDNLLPMMAYHHVTSWRCCTSWLGVCRTCFFGTSMAKPRSHRWPRCSGRRISFVRRVHAAARS